MRATVEKRWEDDWQGQHRHESGRWQMMRPRRVKFKALPLYAKYECSLCERRFHYRTHWQFHFVACSKRAAGVADR